MKSTRIGIDLVEVSRIREMLEKHGPRFKERNFTSGEIAYCDSCADPAMHYAARFAAKEAAAKALGTGLWNEGVNWTDIEVTREENGRPVVLLHGAAKKHAGDAVCLVSLTHTRELAMAQVLLA
jgi:holo-[acyl-carrier protein] synthase